MTYARRRHLKEDGWMPRWTPFLDHFLGLIDQRGEDECWPWQGSTTHGHGQVESRNGAGKRVHIYAHRLALELSGVRIPDGMVADHECHNRDLSCAGGEQCQHRRCCNPSHLSVVTPGRNSMTGRGFGAAKAAQTHCIHGHPFTPANTGYRTPPGKNPQRYCRSCSHARLANIIRRPGRTTS